MHPLSENSGISAHTCCNKSTTVAIIMKTIGMFPASGKLGGSTIRYLLRLVPYDRVVLICRHPDKAPAEYVQGGVRVRQAAYEASPAELEAVFAGIDVLFLISYASHVHEYRTKSAAAGRRRGIPRRCKSSTRPFSARQHPVRRTG